MSEAITVVEFDEQFTSPFAPFVLDRRSRATPLTQLSAGFLVSQNGGSAEPWTLPYEEVLYGIEGRATLHVEGQKDVVVGPGDFVVLPKGTTVVYEAAPGTRILYAVAPADWEKDVPEAWAAAQASPGFELTQGEDRDA